MEINEMDTDDKQKELEVSQMQQPALSVLLTTIIGNTPSAAVLGRWFDEADPRT